MPKTRKDCSTIMIGNREPRRKAGWVVIHYVKGVHTYPGWLVTRSLALAIASRVGREFPGSKLVDTGSDKLKRKLASAFRSIRA